MLIFFSYISVLDFVVSKTINPKSISLKDKLCQFNIIITAHNIFLPIFKSIDPTSTCLQTKIFVLNVFFYWQTMRQGVAGISYT